MLEVVLSETYVDIYMESFIAMNYQHSRED